MNHVSPVLLRRMLKTRESKTWIVSETARPEDQDPLVQATRKFADGLAQQTRPSG